jgi:hypothetical protein
VRREFSGLPVYVGVEEGYVKRTAPMDQRQFRRYLETCRRLSFRFDRWEVGQAAGGAEDRLGLISADLSSWRSPARTGLVPLAERIQPL